MSDYDNQLNDEEVRDYTESASTYREGASCSEPGCGCENKKCRLPMIAGLILLVAVLVGGGFFFYQKVFGNPLNQLLLGMNEIYKEKGAFTVSEVSFEVMEENKDVKKVLTKFVEAGVESSEEQLYDYLSAVLPNFKIKYSTGVSAKPEDINFGVKFDLLYKDKSLIDLLYHVKPWEARVASEKVLSKPIYFDIAKFVKTMSGGMTDLSKFSLKEYLEILYEKDEFTEGLKDSEYIKIIREVLEDKITKQDSKFELTLSNKENVEMMKRFFSVGKTDEKLKNSVISKVTKILNLATERKDYELFGLSKEEFSRYSSMAKVQLETGFSVALSEAEKIYDSPEYLKALNEMDDVAIKYVFTMSGKKISEVESSANLGGILLKVHTKYGEEDSYLKTVKEKSGEDVIDLSNVQEDPLSAMSFVTETLSNFDKQVLKGEAFGLLSEDFKTQAKEKLSVEDAAKIVAFFDDVVPNLINNGLKAIMGGGY